MNLHRDTVGLALSHHLAGRRREAEGLCRRVLEAEPKHAGALHLLGIMAEKQGRGSIAIKLFRMAVAAAPADGSYRNSLAVALGEAGRLHEAMAEFAEAVRLDPSFADARCNLANALARLGRLDEATAEYGRALRLRPDDVAAVEGLLAVRHEAGDLDGVIEARRRTVELLPRDAARHSDLLYMLHYREDLSREQVFREHFEWARRHAAPLPPAAPPSTPHAPRPTDRNLRIGYVGADGFRQHPVATFQEQMIRYRDRSRFTVVCYSDVTRPDHVTERIKAAADEWRDTGGMGDAAVAELVRRDRIDVLVDLHGHSSGNRLLVFARKPAPVQVTCNGYIDTTGMAAMDWRLTDALHDPPSLNEDRYYKEKLYRLPGCCWCYRPDEDAPPVGDLPALRAGGAVTFGCLNKFLKVSPRAMRLWARVLEAVPGARLVLPAPGGGNPQAARYPLSLLEQHGLPPGRVQLLERAATRREYLERFNDIDVSLDPLPYNGVTTTCESLWMGAPVVSLLGAAFHSRAGLALLTAAGLPDLAAATERQYVEIAGALASDLPKLADLRRGLRSRVAASPLCDGPRAALAVEEAYKAMAGTGGSRPA